MAETHHLRSTDSGDVEMHVILEGRQRLNDAGASCLVGPGDVLMLRGRTWDRHAGRGARTLVFRYRDGLGAPPSVAALPSIVHLRAASRTGAVPSLVALIQDELARKSAASQGLLRRLSDALLVAVARACLPPAFDLDRSATDPRIARTLAALHERFAERWTLAKMAKVAGMSRAAFVRHFKHVTGVPPGAYVTRLRLDAARTLLAESDEPAATIAFQVGYQSAYGFNRVFKRIVGQPPIRYRKAMRTAPARIECRAALALAA